MLGEADEEGVRIAVDDRVSPLFQVGGALLENPLARTGDGRGQGLRGKSGSPWFPSRRRSCS